MSDKKSNFSELFENSKTMQDCSTSTGAIDKAYPQSICNAYYIENISFDIINPIPRSHKKPGTNKASLRQFKRNQESINSCQDLHGYTRKAAIKALATHIAQCQSKGILYFLVIFGKGLSSPQEPVLKKTVCSYLIACPEVLAYEFTKPRDGGDGAAYVMLKRR